MNQETIQNAFARNHSFTRCLTLVATGLFLSSRAIAGQTTESVKLKSPDGKIVVTVQDETHLSYSVTFQKKTAVENSDLGLTVDGKDFGTDTAILGLSKINELNEPYPVLGVHDTVENHCFAATLSLRTGDTPWQIEFKLFNDGVAYRYVLPGTGARHIDGEDTAWTLPVGSEMWYQAADNTSYESRFVSGIAGQLPSGLQIMAPTTVELPEHAGYAMLSEANLLNYSDLSLQATGNTFKAFFHNSRQGWTATNDIVSPWRVTLLAANLTALVNSDLIKNLCPAPSPELAKADWIRPGRSIWHWLTGGSPKLEEQHAWIDGAKAMGYEYYLVDDGWRKWNGGDTNAWNALAEVVQYAKSQNVEIWAWVNARYVLKPDDRLEYFKNAKRIGLVGLKIDFPEPADPQWVNWYDDTLRDAAAAQLMVDFHGAVKPTGRERTWPNELTREAIAGREQGKNPSLHDTTLPFVRYVQGHADYTPTLFIPKRLDGSSFAHELAMAVVFTSPYLCLGDNPKHYLESPAADVLKALPSTWNETIVLPPSEIGHLAAFARRHGHQWFIGAINDVTPRREKISLNFLGKGKFTLVELSDSPERNDAFVRKTGIVTSQDTLIMPLRKDGGYVAWLIPAE